MMLFLFGCADKHLNIETVAKQARMSVRAVAVLCRKLKKVAAAQRITLSEVNLQDVLGQGRSIIGKIQQQVLQQVLLLNDAGNNSFTLIAVRSALQALVGEQPLICRNTARNYIHRMPYLEAVISTFRKSCSVETRRITGATRRRILFFFQRLKYFFETYAIPDELIFNADETRLELHEENSSFKCGMSNGTEPRHIILNKSTDNVTLFLCGSATGNFVRPLFVTKVRTLKSEFMRGVHSTRQQHKTNER
mmetsp:Transcript_45201/g.116964  ORF Transcript_45201/g.116964 Transcript_45201/m.116964 type:complete len:250 (+) Transcript_45201:646-1395(+)